MATAGDVCVAARAWLGDRRTPPDTWTNAALLPYVQRAYEALANRLRAEDITLFRRESSTLAVNAGVTTLTRAAPSFPTDLLRPLELQERPAAGGTWKPMIYAEGYFEDRPAIATLEKWAWRDDQFFFPAASQNNVIRCQYEADLPALTAEGSVVKIQAAVEAVARLACLCLAVSKKQAEDVALFTQLAEVEISQIVKGEKVYRQALKARTR